MRRWFCMVLAAAALGFSATQAWPNDIKTCSGSGSSGEAAVDACTRLISSGKFDGKRLALVYFARATNWSKSERDKAIADYTESIRLDPKNSEVHNTYFLRGGLWVDQRDFDRAIADFNAAINLKPKELVYYLIRADALTKKEDYDRAIADYEIALKINPRDADAYLGRAVVWLAKGDYDRAIADSNEAVKINPKSSGAYINRSDAWFRKGDLNRAIADSSEAIKLDAKEAVAFHNRGEALLAKGELERAFADLNEALRLKPDSLSTFFVRGRVFEARGDLARARTDYVAALAFTAVGYDEKRDKNAARERLEALDRGAAPPASPQVATAAVTPPASAPAPTPVSSGRRVALVIGNSTYRAFPKIPNPRNDAEDLAKALGGLGFEVVLGTDLTRADMEERLIRFSRQARGADTALVFYAGHGLQHQGINYLAPVDARLDDESDLRRLVNLQDVIADLQGASRVRILMVDACRDNEAVQQLASSLPKTRAAAFSRGLAKVDADGTLIAFATQANRVAADGDGRNSPFTTALLKHLPMPGVELRTLMTRVRADVVQSTEGRQRPEVWDSLVGEFAFK